jgi:hypothetical protein
VVRSGRATALLGQSDELLKQGWRDGLLPVAVVLLVQPDGRALVVEVGDAQAEGALPPRAGLEVEPDEQKVELRVVGRGGNGVHQFDDLAIGQCSAAAPRPARLDQQGGGVRGHEPARGGAAEHRSQGRHRGLARRAAGRAGAALLDTRSGLVDDLLEVANGEAANRLITAELDGEPPIRAIPCGGGGRERRNHRVDHFREGCGSVMVRGGLEIGQPHTERPRLLEQDPGPKLGETGHRSAPARTSPRPSRVEVSATTTGPRSRSVPMR